MCAARIPSDCARAVDERLPRAGAIASARRLTPTFTESRGSAGVQRGRRLEGLQRLRCRSSRCSMSPRSWCHSGRPSGVFAEPLGEPSARGSPRRA